MSAIAERVEVGSAVQTVRGGARARETSRAKKKRPCEAVVVPSATMLSAKAARLGLRLAGARQQATAVAAAKLDWSELSAQLSSDDAKREVSKLKKMVEDTKEMLSAQAKASAHSTLGAEGRVALLAHALLWPPCSSPAGAVLLLCGEGGSRRGRDAASRPPVPMLPLTPSVRLPRSRRLSTSRRTARRSPPRRAWWTCLKKRMPVRAGTRPSPPSLTACPRLSPPPAHLLRPLPGLALPKYEGKEGEQLLAKFAELEKSTADVEVAARKRITELEAMLAALGVEKAALKTLTVDQVLAADKELANTLNTDIVRPFWPALPRAASL